MALPMTNHLWEITMDDREYKELLESIRLVYGYDFTDYAESSVRRRMTHFMMSHEIKTIDQLAKKILKDDSAFEEFVQELSITVTEMFRDPSFYQCIRKEVMKRLATYPVIRIWIAGCATGEEIYSMAIQLQEEGLLERAIVYATDINQRSLQIAKEGLYSLSNMQTYTNNYLKAGGKNEFSEYYVANHDSVLFDKSLSRNVIFSPHNLATDGSFNEFQLIICRNVLMYFNQSLQNKVVNLFYDSLCHFGFLGLGDKESLLFADKRNLFAETSRKEKIYMKVN
jgi:chemotaxis protein methyltransferase CheR